MKPKFSTAILGFVFLLVSCGEKNEVVESGSYRGIVDRVDPSKKEIYVKTSDNKTLELTITENTSLTQNGKSVEFIYLNEGQQVAVDVEKKGNRLEPLAVKILD